MTQATYSTKANPKQEEAIKTTDGPLLIIAVSDEKQLQTIKNECEGLLHAFRNALATWPVSEVLQVGEQIQAAIHSIDKLGLVQGFWQELSSLIERPLTYSPEASL